MAPSKFEALSSNTAVFAFCNARESIVFLSFSRFTLVRCVPSLQSRLCCLAPASELFDSILRCC